MIPDVIPVRPLQLQVRYLTDDLRRQVVRDADLRGELRREHAAGQAAQRVGGGFEAWLEDVLDQAAVAWVLGCVFVRFCEDNRLVEPVWIGGPAPEAPVQRAMDARQAYLVANPLHNDRHWLRQAFDHLRGLRATARIFNGHNPVWRFDLSGPAAEGLSEFFRQGEGYVSLRDPELDTRFLGDLYEELSGYARSAYALRQTPRFVEEFILDRVLEPAIAEFGLAETSVIDPTCGSGHFLLGAFDRLVDRWRRREPGTGVDVLVERALAQVTGVDLNPFAVAIARFRLLVAALRLCGRTSLEKAPALPVRVATGDSLLLWDREQRGEQVTLDGAAPFAFQTEDADLLADYLRPGRYTVVVGNPPYITVSDPARNQRYRQLYPQVCYRQYALTVPFAQRFFELARRGDHRGGGAGHVGQITSNSFMKREFGKKLIEEYLAHQVELTEVVDTSGAYIPGHGTPTVILVGRNRLVSPRYSGPVRTVLGIQGEPAQPKDPARGLVWSAIVDQIDRPGTESRWVSAVDLERGRLAKHPWSLSGGGADALVAHLTGVAVMSMGGVIEPPIGRAIRAGADEAFVRPVRRASGLVAVREVLRPLVVGEVVRDWGTQPDEAIWYPYAESLDDTGLASELWQWRAFLAARRTFQGDMAAAGLRWWEYMQHTASAYTTPLSIVFAFVATHNHFVLDRGGKVFNRSAPVIKLPEAAGEDDHLRLLGVLNSSTACFWLKQVSHNKGRPGAEQAGADEPWEHRFEFTGTKLEQFPLPGQFPLELARKLDRLAQRLQQTSPAAVAASGAPTRQRLAGAREEWHAIRARLISLQEELDWQVYHLYQLTDEELTIAEPPPLTSAERAFAILLARQRASGETSTTWFDHHNHRFTPVTELPEHWPAAYRALVARRIELIGADRNIGLIERPECKRRWSTDGWEALQQAALRGWLLDRLEAPEVWGDDPEPRSVLQLAERVRHDGDFRAVLDLWVGHDQHDPVRTLGTLVADEHVPYLAVYRYKPSGLRKRRAWERTWELQRREDAGEKVEIEVPPRYASGDFARTSYWRNRGKLDVPKERFVSYPRAGRDDDDTPLLGWAGWDHLGQAGALAAVYLQRRQQQGWPAERLLPLLAGLAELEPWLHQWHDDPRPGYPGSGSPAEFFTGLIDTELAALGADRSILATIRGIPGRG
jgi:hypothetical protein